MDLLVPLSCVGKENCCLFTSYDEKVCHSPSLAKMSITITSTKQNFHLPSSLDDHLDWAPEMGHGPVFSGVLMTLCPRAIESISHLDPGLGKLKDSWCRPKIRCLNPTVVMHGDHGNRMLLSGQMRVTGLMLALRY